MSQHDIEIDGSCSQSCISVDALNLPRFAMIPSNNGESRNSDISTSYDSIEKDTAISENISSNHSYKAAKRVKTESNSGSKPTVTLSGQVQGIIREGQKCLNLLTVLPHHLAMSGNFEQSFKWLLTQIAPYLGVPDNLGDVALNTALQRGEKSEEHTKIALLIAEIMRDNGCGRAFHTVNSSGHSTLFTAAGCETDVGMKVIEILLEEKVNVTLCDVEGQNVLHHCAQFNYLRSMTCILNHLRKNEPVPKLLNICNNDGRAPLHVAIHNGHLKMVQLLLEYGADRNQHRQGCGDTPLIEAVERLRSSEGCETEIDVMEALLSSACCKRDQAAASPNLRRFNDHAAPLHLLMLLAKVPGSDNKKDRNHPLIMKAIALLRKYGARIKFNEDADILSEHKIIFSTPIATIMIEHKMQRLEITSPETCSMDSGVGSSCGSSSEASLLSSESRVVGTTVEVGDSLTSLPETDVKLLSERIGKNWRSVLQRLNLKRGDIDFAAMTDEPLKYAFNTSGKNLSRQQLSEALLAEQRRDLAEFVSDIHLYNDDDDEEDDDDDEDDDDNNDGDSVVDCDK